jgi:hypothetical protein
MLSLIQAKWARDLAVRKFARAAPRPPSSPRLVLSPAVEIQFFKPYPLKSP